MEYVIKKSWFGYWNVYASHDGKLSWLASFSTNQDAESWSFRHARNRAIAVQAPRFGLVTPP